MKSDKIIAIVEAKSINRRCNICDKESKDLIELRLGSRKRMSCQCILMCKGCLSELGDLIWNRGI